MPDVGPCEQPPPEPSTIRLTICAWPPVNPCTTICATFPFDAFGARPAAGTVTTADDPFDAGLLTPLMISGIERTTCSGVTL